jgi:hypothetical protein
VDDFFFLLALAILITNSILYIWLVPMMYTVVRVQLGLEKPKPTIMKTATQFLKYQMGSTILFWSLLWSVKACFLAFFYSLGNNLKTQRILWYSVAIFTGIGYICSVISYPLACPSFNASGYTFRNSQTARLMR